MFMVAVQESREGVVLHVPQMISFMAVKLV